MRITGKKLTLNNDFDGSNITMPVASTYDVDKEYSTIMNMALQSYHRVRDKDKTENRRRALIKSASVKRRHQTCSMKSTPRPSSIGLSSFDAIKEVEQANNVADRTNRKVLQVSQITISMDNLSQREKAFVKRNHSTFSWYSQSVPNAQSFQKLMNSFDEPPSGKTSTSKKERPGTAYSYDGGLFTNPKSHKPEYFVIHPEWVSEAMTIQKLSLTERNTRNSTWPGRRCRSAPPPKYRNPITWET